MLAAESEGSGEGNGGTGPALCPRRRGGGSEALEPLEKGRRAWGRRRGVEVTGGKTDAEGPERLGGARVVAEGEDWEKVGAGSQSGGFICPLGSRFSLGPSAVVFPSLADL